MKVGNEFRVGTIIAPKKGSGHHKRYGNFVGEIKTVIYGGSIEWRVLEEGNGNWPVKSGNHEVKTTGIEDFEDITDIYNSPLWRALS